jgi:tRNA dimethylallyltransferase
LSIQIAESLKTEILSADSRQFYSELSIGTARPDFEELQAVKHHFIGHLSIHDYYNISRFEEDALSTLNQLFVDNKFVLLVGGSGLYIDAVVKGIDLFPDPDPELRNHLKGILIDEGIDKLKALLWEKDPAYFETVDTSNPNRLLRALEVCMTTGIPFSAQRLNKTKTRNFRILKVGLNLPREQLFERINRRVEDMMQKGLLEEVRSMMPYRHLNALNTVGYKELFAYLDGALTLEKAVENIKTNTRRYAKRQLTWFKRDPEIHWFSPENQAEIEEWILNPSSFEKR